MTAPILTILTSKWTSGILCRGIHADETVFTNRLYADYPTAIDQISRTYKDRFRIIFDINLGRDDEQHR